MPQHVRRYALRFQRWTSLAGDARVLDNERLNAVGAKLTAVHVGEQYVSAVAHWLLDPRLKGALGVRCQRRTSLLPSLAETSHMCPVAEMDDILIEVDQADSTGRRNTFDQGGVYGATGGADAEVEAASSSIGLRLRSGSRNRLPKDSNRRNW